MRDEKRPVLLTTDQIATLQDMILEKQYQLAAAQAENLQSTDYAMLSEKMSHTTDLLMTLATALQESGAPEARTPCALVTGATGI